MHIIVRQTSLHICAVTLFISVFVTASSYAELKPGNFTQFTEQYEYGLPGSKVNSLIQDKFGCISAGTNNALTLYEFKRNYSNPNNSASFKTMQSKLFEYLVTFIRPKSFPGDLNKHNSTKILFTQSNCYCLYEYHFIINQNLSL